MVANTPTVARDRVGRPDGNTTPSEKFTQDDFERLGRLLESTARTPDGKLLKNSAAYRAAQAFKKCLSGETPNKAFGRTAGNPKKERDRRLTAFCWEVFRLREMTEPPMSMPEIQTELEKAGWEYELNSNFYKSYNQRLPAMWAKAAGMMGFFEPFEEGSPSEDNPQIPLLFARDA